jgi:hypothetical protein
MAEFGTISTSSRIPIGNYFTPISGRFIRNSSGVDTTATTRAGAANVLEIAPFIPQTNVTIDELSIIVATAVASSLVKIVVYDSDANGRPTTLLFESSDLDTSSTGTKSASLSASTLLAGKIYWFGVRHSSTATLRANQLYNSLNIDNGSAPSTNMIKVLRRTVTFANAAPDPFVFDITEGATTGASAIWMRVV